MSNEKIIALIHARQAAEAQFAAACRQLSDAQKACHATRNAMKSANRAYLAAIEAKETPCN